MPYSQPAPSEAARRVPNARVARRGNPEIAARFARGPEFGVVFC